MQCNRNYVSGLSRCALPVKNAAVQLTLDLWGRQIYEYEFCSLQIQLLYDPVEGNIAYSMLGIFMECELLLLASGSTDTAKNLLNGQRPKNKNFTAHKVTVKISCCPNARLARLSQRQSWFCYNQVVLVLALFFYFAKPIP